MDGEGVSVVTSSHHCIAQTRRLPLSVERDLGGRQTRAWFRNGRMRKEESTRCAAMLVPIYKSVVMSVRGTFAVRIPRAAEMPPTAAGGEPVMAAGNHDLRTVPVEIHIQQGKIGDESGGPNAAQAPTPRRQRFRCTRGEHTIAFETGATRHMAKHRSDADVPASLHEPGRHPTVRRVRAPRRRFKKIARPKRCPYPNCHRTYLTNTGYMSHMRAKHWAWPATVCPAAGCNARFTHRESLASHVLHKHTASERHKCGEPGCGRRFPSALRLRQHVLCHGGKKPFACLQCGRRFAYKDSMSYHVHVFHNGGAPKHTTKAGKFHSCAVDGCGRSFRSPGELATHMTGHTTPWICGRQGCGAAFMTAMALERHTASAHTGQKRYVCLRPGCHLSYLSAHGLAWHGKTDHGPQRFPCKLPGCHHSFPSRSALTSHMKAHPGMKVFPCKICGKKYLTNSGRDAHLASHLPNKAYVCDLDGCSKGYVYKTGLRTHQLQTHGRLTPPTPPLGQLAAKKYVCRIEDGCGKAYVHRCSLRKHQLRAHGTTTPPTPAPVHSTRKAYACGKDGCAKSYAHRSGLRQHELRDHGRPPAVPVHPAKKKYVCGVDGCQKAYVSRSGLRAHRRQNHAPL